MVIGNVEGRVLAAAVEVFRERGFAGASVREVAERAGVGEDAVRERYAEKEALLAGVLAGLGAGSGEREGGEPACLLDSVCPECGRMAQESDARYCARCGERLPRA
ncbi:helix-turn-helix domain-containing protein [Streptomyces sp. ODS28]|uniref:TetR/AcrR family transcriptional regulator n=1 Tax=Streptomyces sp. ODS28 TaxID=3136688 RepID=UPI0031EC2CAE